MIKKNLKSLINSLGYEIQRKLSDKEKDKIEFAILLKNNKWLIEYDFKTIIDIGANEGQFAHKMRKLFPGTQIIAFEPLTHVCKLLDDSFENDKRFSSYNIGLGEKEESLQIFLNEYSPSSSLLKMKDHIRHFDYAITQSPVTVKIVPLDQILKVPEIERPYMVKIDVQGYEKQVINGGKNVISDASMVITEVSFTELYENNILFDEVYILLKNMGFSYVGNFEQLHSPANNQILQADAIFIK